MLLDIQPALMSLILISLSCMLLLVMSVDMRAVLNYKLAMVPAQVLLCYEVIYNTGTSDQ